MKNKEVEKEYGEMEIKIHEGLRKYHPEYKKEPYKIVAVGYLDPSEPYENTSEHGEVPAGFVEKLKSLFHKGLMLASLGHHDCEFCLNQGVKEEDLPKEAQSSCQKSLNDEKNNIKYFFPEMIFHYIEVHLFKPPKEFIEFVMKK